MKREAGLDFSSNNSERAQQEVGPASAVLLQKKLFFHEISPPKSQLQIIIYTQGLSRVLKGLKTKPKT